MMLFENPEVDISHLPKVSEMTWSRPDSGHLHQGLIQTGLVFLVLAAGVAIAWFQVSVTLFLTILGLYLGLLSLSLLVVVKDHKARGYAVRRRDISVRSGWIFRTQTTVPFNRIQHVEIKEGAIERLFNLGTLQVFTAGGSSSDLSVPGLPVRTATRIKDYISGIIAGGEEMPANMEEEE